MKRERDDDEDRPLKREDEDGLQKQAKVEKGQTPHGRGVSQAGQMQGHTHPAREAKPTVTNAYDYLSQVKQKCPPPVTTELFRVLKEYKSNRLDRREVIRAVSELLAGHEDLIEGFNAFLPSSEKIDKDRPVQDYDEEDDYEQEDENDEDEEEERPSRGGGGRGSIELVNAKNFIERAKMRFEGQPDIYKTFISLLREFHEKKGAMTINILYKKIVALFEGHPDLIAGIQSFLPESVESGGSEAEDERPRGKARKGGKGGRKGARPAVRREKEKEKEKERERPLRVMPLVVERSRDHNRAEEFVAEDLNLFFLIKKRLDNRQHFHDFMKCLNLYTNNVITRVQLMLLVFDILGKYPDLLQRFKGFMRFTVHEEQELIEELHELCESDKEMSEERRKRWADNIRFELNMLITETTAAINQLVQTLKEMAELTDEALTIVTFNVARLDDACRKTIERLYGDRSQDVLQAIYSNPSITIPIVIKRMKQKEAEWRGLKLKYTTDGENGNAANQNGATDGSSVQPKEETKGDGVNKQQQAEWNGGDWLNAVKKEAMDTDEGAAAAPSAAAATVAAAATPCTEEKEQWEKVRNGEREEPLKMEVDQSGTEEKVHADAHKTEEKAEEPKQDGGAGGIATTNGTKHDEGRMGDGEDDAGTPAVSHNKEEGTAGKQDRERVRSGGIDSIADYHHTDDKNAAEALVATSMLY